MLLLLVVVRAFILLRLRPGGLPPREAKNLCAHSTSDTSDNIAAALLGFA